MRKINRSSLLARICVALEENPRVTAAKLGVPYEEFVALLALAPGMVVPPNRDEMWTLLDAHISQKIAGLFAVREEISRMLRRARKAQLAERTRVLKR